MAAKKTTTFQLPPMFPRVVVADALSSAAAKSRFFAVMQQLEASSVVYRVMRLVRLERGVWLREGHRWPPAIQRVADRAFRSAGLLDDLLSPVFVATHPQVPERDRQVMEQQLRRMLQSLMDELYEAGKDPHGRVTEAMAGLIGLPVELEALGTSSGVEAAWRLAAGVRRALLGKMNDPFWPYVVSAASQRRMRKQVGRERPDSVGNLEQDDLKILQACQGEPLPAKAVATKANLSASHVSKRKADLRCPPARVASHPERVNP